jgi:hypothetical protein
MSNVTIGNVQFEYNKYTFALPPLGGWGWKGVTAEGDLDSLNYHAFYIKHAYDGNTSGTRLTSYHPSWKAAATIVSSYQSAQLQGDGSTVANGIIMPDNNLRILPVSRDTVYFGELAWWTLDKTVQLEVNAGGNAFHQYATVISTFGVVTAPGYPVYDKKLDPQLEQYDRMSRFNVQTDNLLWEGLHTAAEYRYVGENYKPVFRLEPYYFDDVDGNQDGFNVSATQKIGGVQMSSQYITFNRVSGNGNYRDDFLWDIGYYGFHGIDIAYHGETVFSQYVYESSRTIVSYQSPSQRMQSGEIYIRAQFDADLVGTVSLKRMQWNIYNGDPEDAVDKFHARLEYKLNTNAKLTAETCTTVYGKTESEPQGWPYDDNFSRITFELTF